MRVDLGHLEQVIINLVVNARDAMPSGGQLTIRTANVRRAADPSFADTLTDHVLLEVSDTGVGMDEATRSRMFEPFFTTKAKERGTGLGLSTVFGIVAQSGGSIAVQSELGVGTTLQIYLPRVAAAPTLPLAIASEPPRTRGNETILLIEDEAQVRAVIGSILLRAGYRVIEASSPEEGIRLSRAEPGKIELVLTDVVMPKMNGLEVAAIISAERPESKVLWMSGYTDERVFGHDLEEASYLQKPITPGNLARKVREVLDR
ncbi:hypothetical protein BH09MYX1_BH09MYX1_18990 [soil metagenome]